MLLTRRDWLGAGLALTGALASPGAFAAVDGCGWLDGRTMTFIVPFPAGGGYDTYARLLATAFGKLTGVQVAVSNLASSPVGAMAIRDSRPDGLTVGILHGGEVMFRRLLEGADQPDLFRTFTVLGQVADTPTVWVVSAKSDVKTVDDLVALAARRPILAGVRTVNGADFAGFVSITHIAGMPLEVVPGYKGSGEVLLSLARGEIDLASYSAASVQPFIESGEARPILQLASRPVPDAPFLDNVPVLAGPGGWLVQRATQRGAAPDAALLQADGLASALGQPRVVVAPAGLEPAAADCLRRLFMAAVAEPSMVEGAAAAKQPLDPLPGGETVERLRAAAPLLEELLPVIRDAQRRVRS